MEFFNFEFVCVKLRCILELADNFMEFLEFPFIISTSLEIVTYSDS